jgi:hypothetical protein
MILYYNQFSRKKPWLCVSLLNNSSQPENCGLSLNQLPVIHLAPPVLGHPFTLGYETEFISILPGNSAMVYRSALP